MKKDTGKAADLFIACIVIAVSIIFFIEASRMPTPDRGIGAGSYPKIICIVLFSLGIIQIAEIIIECRGIPVIDFKNVNVRYLFRAFIMIVMTYVYYRLLKPVGFLLTTPVYLFGSMMLFGYKKKIVGAVISIVFSATVYFLFVNVFLVILPRGILG